MRSELFPVELRVSLQEERNGSHFGIPEIKLIQFDPAEVESGRGSGVGGSQWVKSTIVQFKPTQENEISLEGRNLHYIEEELIAGDSDFIDGKLEQLLVISVKSQIVVKGDRASESATAAKSARTGSIGKRDAITGQERGNNLPSIGFRPIQQLPLIQFCQDTDLPQGNGLGFHSGGIEPNPLLKEERNDSEPLSRILEEQPQHIGFPGKDLLPNQGHKNHRSYNVQGAPNACIGSWRVNYKHLVFQRVNNSIGDFDRSIPQEGLEISVLKFNSRNSRWDNQLINAQIMTLQ